MFWIDCSGASEEKWLGEARVDVDNPYIWEAALEHYLVVSSKVKHTPTLWPGNFILRYLSKLNENICSQKYLHKNFYSSHIGKSKNDLPKPYKSLSKDEFLSKLWCIYTLAYYSAIWRKGLLTDTTQMILKSMGKKKDRNAYTIWIYWHEMKSRYRKNNP